MFRYTPQNTLIVFALQSEAQGCFNDLPPLFTGIGKVNAAYKLTKSIEGWKQKHQSLPHLILNIGSAGSTEFARGAIVNCTEFVQRDFDVTALGHAPFTTPNEGTPTVLANGLRFPNFPQGVCGTGDNFATDGLLSQWNVVDMEAYALAKICQYETIPFGCLKYITDGADGQAAESWENMLPEVALKLREAVDGILFSETALS